MKALSVNQIRADNPHFGSKLRVVERDEAYRSPRFDFTCAITVGSKDAHLEGLGTIDAWATYLWSPSKNAWVLGAN